MENKESGSITILDWGKIDKSFEKYLIGNGIKPTLKNKINDGLATYSFIVSGEGTMSGEEFSRKISSYCSTENPKNFYFCELFRKFIVDIDVDIIGRCRYSFKLD
jgi:hypothetical protein